MKKIRTIFLILVILGMFLSMANVQIGNAKVNQSTIKIGGLGPLAITPGKDMKAGAELAVKEINDAGGVTVGGTAYDFELITETTSHPTTGLPDTDTAVTSAAKLMDQDDVVSMFGLFRTEVTVAVMATLDRPFLGVGSTAPIITPYFWRLSPSNGTQLTRALLDLYALGLVSKGVVNITIVREDAVWSLAMSGGIKYYLHTALPYAYGIPVMNFTSDIKISEGAPYSVVESAITPIKSKLDGLNVNAIMTIFSGPAGRHITEAWSALNMTQYLAGINVEAQSSTHFEETKGAAYGEIYLIAMPADKNVTTKSGPFKQAYWDEHAELPTYTAAASYDAVYVIKDAITRANSYDSNAIQVVLNETDYLGAQYKVAFTSEPNVWNHSTFGYPYGHVTYNDDGTRKLIPGVPTNLTVHDLHTPATVGVSGTPYTSGMWVQWQADGVQKTIWGYDPVATRKINDYLVWPINHAEHGYTTTTEAEETPGFELPVILLALSSFIAVVHLRKRKKR